MHKLNTEGKQKYKDKYKQKEVGIPSKKKRHT